MPQYSGEGLDIHPILQGQRGKGMAQAMEASVLQSCIFEELLMEMIDGIRAIHLPRHWRWEHIGITRMQTVLLDQQVHCLLGHDLYFTATRRADELAMKLRKAFAAQGIPFWVESFTNQQFVILTDAQKETLEKRYIFEPMGKSADGGNIARFCTSWATTEEEVQTLIDDLKAL